MKIVLLALVLSCIAISGLAEEKKRNADTATPVARKLLTDGGYYSDSPKSAEAPKPKPMPKPDANPKPKPKPKPKPNPQDQPEPKPGCDESSPKEPEPYMPMPDMPMPDMPMPAMPMPMPDPFTSYSTPGTSDDPTPSSP
ncbi:protein TsetseEP-like [Selaginella moellendorffii]|uniref:protein TsetseEP-like n=1 Tax=Selaginella moellendorffii TaxID=88036 RepID=UPI000D1CB482|nr:protein TsetseEP-like [Selaginella moellendorffii]|eukprot:XP_024520261.1 protein TsetseEP-like [Selaginella moellendorffii]